MSGNQIIDVQEPNRKAMMAQLIAEMIGQHQQKQAAEQQTVQTAQDAQGKEYAKQFLALPADQQAANFDRLPDNAKKWVLSTQGYAPHQLTPQEKFDQDKARFGSDTFANPSLLGPGQTDARYHAVTGANPNADVSKADVAQTVYSQPQTYGPDMQNRQKIEDKAVPTGQENWTDQNIALPTSKANIGHINAETGKVNADARLSDKKTQVLGTTGVDADQTGDRDVRTTVSGSQYADISGYTGKDKNNLKKYYEGRGIPALDKSGAEAIQEVDNARMNQKMLLDQIESKLPKDAMGRPIGGAANRLGQVFQTDADLAAFGSWRASAIQSLRAVAGSKGLRINQAEIKMAMENDIPQITDTVDTARARVRNFNAMLDSVEKVNLLRNRQTQEPNKIDGAPSSGQPKVGDRKTAANGRPLYFDGNGWTDPPQGGQ